MISLCLTNYQRTDLLYESYRQLINDDRITEIVISDDASSDEVYNTILWQSKAFNKVKVYRNESNLDCYRNKRQAVKLATNDWVIVGDSDNVFNTDYVDKLFSKEWEMDTLWQPSFAKPHFNFKQYEGYYISKANVGQYMSDDTFKTMLNAMNYFVNRDEFLRVWDSSVDPVTSDSIFQNYNWLKSGNSIYVCPGLEYNHLVHEQSHYRNNVRRTPNGFHKSIEDKIKSLS